MANTSGRMMYPWMIQPDSTVFFSSLPVCLCKPISFSPRYQSSKSLTGPRSNRVGCQFAIGRPAGNTSAVLLSTICVEASEIPTKLGYRCCCSKEDVPVSEPRAGRSWRPIVRGRRRPDSGCARTPSPDSRSARW